MSFAYNDAGLRISKTANGVTTHYVYDGDILIAEYTDSDTIIYIYDAYDNPIGFKYRSNSYASDTWDVYWYGKNAQGDILHVYDDFGTKLVSYTYTAWGKTTISYSGSGASTTAVKNNLTYRGYYYDSDLGMYYLQSRYYDPIVCRFINADSALYDNLSGYNLFAYCYNNPVMYIDPTGCSPDWDLLFNGSMMVVLGGLTFTAVLLTGGSCLPWVAAAYAVVATASVATATSGAFEVYESFTGENPAKDFVGEETYETIKNVSIAIMSFAPAVISYGTTVSVCFIAGTLVKAENGDKSIEDICIGDKVYAYNDETGEIALKSVVNTFVNEATELVHVFVNNEEIICTNEHPFYSPVKGWTEACQLRAGDILVSLNGEYVIVEKVQHEILESPVKVYNFEVEDFHTYYVGNGDGVLVHNDCGPNGTYEDASYHTTGNSIKSPRPIDGQSALDNSIQITPNSARRIGISNNQFVVLVETSPGLYHGHVRTWTELTNKMQAILYKQGKVSLNGKIK